MAQTTQSERKTLLRSSQRLRTIVSFSLIILTLALLWEGYKWMGQTTDGVWPGTNLGLPVRTNNRAMPHLWDIAAALFRPARTGATQWSGAPLPLPIRTSAGLLVTGLSGKIRIQMRPPRLTWRVIAIRAASIWRAVSHPRSTACSA